ncbi:MAG: EAL domain-containing protein [Leptothrix sp. (in: b-proteobacteria)]
MNAPDHPLDPDRASPSDRARTAGAVSRLEVRLLAALAGLGGCALAVSAWLGSVWLGAPRESAAGALGRAPLDPGWVLGGVALLAALLTGLALQGLRQRRRNDASDLARAAADARLRAFTSAIPDASFLFDREGHYLEIFGPPERVNGAVRHRRGQRIDEVHDPLISAQFMRWIELALTQGDMQQGEYELQVGPRLRSFEARICAVPGQDCVVWVSWDITERKVAERRLGELTRLHRFSSQVSQAIAWSSDARTLFDRTCLAAVEHGGIDLAWVVSAGDADAPGPDAAGARYQVRVCRGPAALVPLAEAALPPAVHSHAVAVADALRQGRLQWRPGSVKRDGQEALDLVVVPIRDGDRVCAALVLVGRTLEPEVPERLSLLDELGRHLSQALARLTRERGWHSSAARMRLHAAALESTQDGVMVTDLQARIVSVNRAFTEITGYSEAEAIGRTPHLLHSGRHERGYFGAMWEGLRRNGRWQGEVWNRRKNGDLYTQWMSLSTVPGDNAEPGHYVAVFTDITPQKLAEQQLHRLVHIDPLTQLPNRLMVLERLGHAIAAAQRGGHRVGVLFIDLDHFKTVNDSLGHAAGDALLAAVAKRLSGRTRRDDTLGRLGGDEFILILERLNDAFEAAQVAQELIDLLDTPFTLAEQEVYVQASVGISLYPDDALEAGELVRNADAAMYQAKRAGRGSHRPYTHSLTQAAQSRLALDTRLRRALEQQEFALVYQPVYRIADQQLIGLEALVRLNQPGLPPVGPAEFIPLLEETGQILALGTWVLNEACRQACAWLDEGLDFGRIAVNLSPVEVARGRTDERVRSALERSGLPPERLELEITESGLMEQGERAEAFLHELRALGVGLAIDDFGTGHSSLAYLKRFPVSKLKIDRSFIRDLPGDSSDAQLVQTMVAMGRNLGITVLAEGVETEAQLDFLRGLGCEAAQGYFFSEPLPAQRLQVVLAAPGQAIPTIDA